MSRKSATLRIFLQESQIFLHKIADFSCKNRRFFVSLQRILIYDDIKSVDVLNAIAYVVKRCNHEGFTPRLYFEETEKRQNIGSIIREVRLKRDLSSKDVAMLVGLAAPNYSRIESGLTSPTYKTLVRIFDVLDIHMDIQPADLAPINVEERAQEERKAAWKIEQKRIIAQVRKEHPKMLLWPAEKVRETKYYQELVREHKGD